MTLIERLFMSSMIFPSGSRNMYVNSRFFILFNYTRSQQEQYSRLAHTHKVDILIQLIRYDYRFVKLLLRT